MGQKNQTIDFVVPFYHIVNSQKLTPPITNKNCLEISGLFC